ncbi:MAG: DUF362 domain-containing protein [Phycisphaeraceae bacterium]
MDSTRRAFLRQVAACSAGLAVATPVFETLARPAHAQGAAASPQPVVAVATGKDYAALVATVLAPLGTITAFVKKGDKVVVKPNIGWDRTPEQAANTHPDVLKAVVKLALDAGATQVLVFDRTCNNAKMCYQHSGIEAAVASLNDDRAQCLHIDDRKFVPVAIKNGAVLTTWDFYKDALEADCYINVPIAKHHGLSKLTLGMKNVMGVIGGKRGQIHQDIGNKLADLNSVIAPKLTIIDATRILLRHGPQGGNLDDVKVLDTLIASRDMIAADAYATTLFGLKPEAITSTVAGHKAGLGEMDLDKVRIVKV